MSIVDCQIIRFVPKFLPEHLYQQEKPPYNVNGGFITFQKLIQAMLQ